MKLCKLNIKVCKRCGWITHFVVKKIQLSIGHIKIHFRGTSLLLIVWGSGWTTRWRCLIGFCVCSWDVCVQKWTQRVKCATVSSLNLYLWLFPEDFLFNKLLNKTLTSYWWHTFYFWVHLWFSGDVCIPAEYWTNTDDMMSYRVIPRVNSVELEGRKKMFPYINSDYKDFSKRMNKGFILDSPVCSNTHIWRIVQKGQRLNKEAWKDYSAMQFASLYINQLCQAFMSLNLVC